MKKALKIFGIVSVSLLFLYLIFIALGNIYASWVAAEDAKVQSAIPVINETPPKQKLLQLVNIERAKHGAKPLVVDARLDESAQYKANDMATRGYFNHIDPMTKKHNGLDKAMSLMGNYRGNFAENLYQGEQQYDTPEEAVIGWIESKSHHEAMIDARYIYTGFGIVNGYYVEHFYSKEVF